MNIQLFLIIIYIKKAFFFMRYEVTAILIKYLVHQIKDAKYVKLIFGFLEKKLYFYLNYQ